MSMAYLRASWPFARQSLAGRRGRTILLVVAVLVASALVVATSCGMASVERSVERGLVRALGATDARIVDRYGSPFDAALVDRVRALPDVVAATPRLFGSLTLARADGRRDDEGRVRRVTVQARGVEAPEDPRFRELELESGRRPEGPGEILLDPVSAEVLAAAVGDRLRVQRFGSPIELEVVGVFKRPRLGALQRPMVELDRGTLVSAASLENGATSILVILADGVDVEAWTERHASLVAEPLVLEPAERIRSGLDRQLLASRLGFTLAAAIAFLSCAFIVAVGLTTAVVEQTREMAIGRCIGAARRHLFGGQLIVGVAIAGVGGVLGVPLGILLASAVVRFYANFLPGGLAVSSLGIGLALAGSLIAGILGAAFPAWQAARVTPLAALTIRARPPRPRGVALCLGLCIACVATQLALLLVPDTQLRFWIYAVLGIALLHVAAFLLAPPALVAITRVAAAPIGAILRLPRGLLAGSVRSMPYRLGFTAGALMVGVSVLVSTQAGANGVLEQLRERLRFGDAFVMLSTGLTLAQQESIRAMPGVVAASPVGFLPVRLAEGQTLGVDGLGPRNVIAMGFEPEAFFELNRIEWIRGTPESALPKLLDGSGILIAEQFHLARGLDLGDSLGLGGKEGDVRFEIVGVVSSAGLDIAVQFFGLRQVYMEIAAGAVFLDMRAIERHFGTRSAGLMQLVLDPASGPELEKQLVELVADRVPGASFASGRQIRSMMDDVAVGMLGVSSAVSFAALLLAAFGVGNVVAAGIGTRRREFGVLLAVGGARTVAPRLVLGETLLVALTAGVVGSLLGIHLALMGTIWHHDLAGIPTRLIVPWGPMLAGWGATALLAVAAALPAAFGLLRRSPRALLAG